MTPRTRCVAASLALLLLPAAPRAQPLVRPSGLDRQSARVEVNAEGMMGMGLGYGYRLEGERDPSLDVAVSFPLLVAHQLDSFRASAGFSSRWISLGRAGLTGGLTLDLTTAGNDVGDFVALGVAWDLVPHWRFDTWTLGVDLGVRHRLATHISHSALARSAFEGRHTAGAAIPDPGPRDGWYSDTATRWIAGLACSVALSRGVTVDAAGGLLLTDQPFGLLAEGMFGVLKTCRTMPLAS